MATNRVPAALRLELGSGIPTAQDVLEDPTTPAWVRRALVDAIQLDPVDAANAAEVLAEVLGARAVRHG